jgi:hypothetical protein
MSLKRAYAPDSPTTTGLKLTAVRLSSVCGFTSFESMFVVLGMINVAHNVVIRVRDLFGLY